MTFRSIWASVEQPLRAAIDAAISDRPPTRTENGAMMGPMAAALAGVGGVMDRAGASARRDLRRGAPPMAMMAWIARHIPVGRPRTRGIVTMIVMMMAMVALVLGVSVALL